VKRALALVVLLAACSHSSSEAGRTPTPTPSASPTASPTAAAGGAPAVSASASAPPVGPAGTRVPAGFHPQSATFVSDTTGWVLGASPCPQGKGSCDVIARTRDGGRTWRAIPSPRTSPDHLAQIRFADQRNGFVTGDQLWATHDGGATWRVVAGVGDVGGIATQDRVWILQDGALRSAPAPGGPFVPERAAHVTSFALHDDTVIYGQQDTDVIGVLRHGRQPTSHHTPCTGGQTVPVMASSRHWLVVCEGEAGLGHEDKHAQETFDAGSTWHPAGDPPQVTGTDVYLTADGDFVVDHQQVSVRRGGTWHVVLSSEGGLSEGGFESAALGYCIGGFDSAATQVMKLTHDAGRTWKTAAF
jgi:hypothetical protein